MATDPIRIMLVDDHAVVRSGLATFLLVFDDLELIGEAGSGKEAVRLCEQLQPDVVLMDLVMPEMDGAAATRVIRERCPETQIIALTSFKEKDLVQGALEAGATAYLLKNVSAGELAEAIRAAHAGRPTLAPEAAQALVLAEKMERFGHAVANAPPDASTLPELLRKHVPGMFPHSQMEIRIFPDQILLHHPADWPVVANSIWEWLRTTSSAHYFLSGMPAPWAGGQQSLGALVVAPIIGIERVKPIGGVYVALPQGDPDAVANWVPAIKSLAAQISSTLYGAQVYAQTLAQQRIVQELALAGQIQASFLPEVLPDLPGWQFAAVLEPARETSGDFYDFIPLANGRWGLMVADVADKGMGAALYMALCRTLIRTYAAEHDAQPDLVLDATNRRILMDARADLFVTAFFGILDPTVGTLTYCSAGHNPAYLLNATKRETVQTLGKTGMALGVLEDAAWDQNTVRLAPGDVLVAYTDGIVEAQNQLGEFFGEERLLKVVQSSLGRPAQGIQDTLIAAVRAFVGNAPQSDDITLMIAIRDLDKERASL